MKRILIASLIGITLVTGLVGTANADQFGSRTWWEQQNNKG